MTTTLLTAAAESGDASDARLILVALAGIGTIVALITWLKLHPFLALTTVALAVALGAGLALDAATTSFAKGFGDTSAAVGLLIGLGAMFGKLLADSGGADQVVDTILRRSGDRGLPWAMALVGAIIGLPMFFEIGLVLLIPVIILVARRSGLPLMRVAIPTLAGLSVMHGLVPPHPGPLLAVGTLDADLGLTLALGVLIAIPTVVVAGPLFSRYAARWVQVPVPDLFHTAADDPDSAEQAPRSRPTFAATLFAILLPVVLMLGRSAADVVAEDSTGPIHNFFVFLGTPAIALTIGVLVAIVVFGRGSGMDRERIATSLEQSLPPVAAIFLIVGAGGGFKQVLIDTGIADVISDAVADSDLSVLLLAWVVAVLIRVATGSATVATVTAAGILQPVAETLSTSHVSLMVLAIGSGSLFLSHVNDAGFWLVKQYTGTSVVQNLKTWTVMECIISVCGLIGVLLLSVVI